MFHNNFQFNSNYTHTQKSQKLIMSDTTFVVPMKYSQSFYITFWIFHNHSFSCSLLLLTKFKFKFKSKFIQYAVCKMFDIFQFYMHFHNNFNYWWNQNIKIKKCFLFLFRCKFWLVALFFDSFWWSSDVEPVKMQV
jgi:hypothetical protein